MQNILVDPVVSAALAILNAVGASASIGTAIERLLKIVRKDSSETDRANHEKIVEILIVLRGLSPEISLWKEVHKHFNTFGTNAHKEYFPETTDPEQKWQRIKPEENGKLWDKLKDFLDKIESNVMNSFRSFVFKYPDNLDRGISERFGISAPLPSDPILRAPIENLRRACVYATRRLIEFDDVRRQMPELLGLTGDAPGSQVEIFRTSKRLDEITRLILEDADVILKLYQEISTIMLSKIPEPPQGG